MGSYGRWVKPLGDAVAALLLLLATAPVLLLAMGLLALQGGPVFFVQQRLGLHGRPFALWKLCSMRPGPQGPVATPLGAVLRRWGVDELPQLLLVLRGTMSLVGPRPLLPQYAPLYSPRQASRHTVRPGITGWAQVHGRNQVPWAQRLELDAQYAERQSLWLDLRIVWLTLLELPRRRPGTSPPLGGA